jgi:hypothetical protein
MANTEKLKCHLSLICGDNCVKTKFLFLFLLLSIQVKANLDIVSMEGCYDVTFEFKEVETAPHARASENYFARAKELIVVDKNTPQEIHLQHILISKSGIIKHWRQEWYKVTENEIQVMKYVAPNRWEMNNFSATNQENIWVQYVSNTDDAPRYSCASLWNNKSWKCQDYAPLPRREYTKRNDYNMMLRGNEVIITNNGWIHAQENYKYLFNENNSPIFVGKEVGSNTYTKISEDVCEEAKLWWEKRRPYWVVVQNMWKHVFEDHNPLLLDPLKGATPLSEKIDSIVESNIDDSNRDAALKKIKKQTHDVIHEFMIE